MLLIHCPWCGPRAEIEFRHGGEAHIARPPDPGKLDDQEWAEHLFLRSNPRGLHAERWIHQYGCQRWFNAVRDTYTDTFVKTYPRGTKPISLGPENAENVDNDRPDRAGST
jgi:sarcosine oxidase subunit delta